MILKNMNILDSWMGMDSPENSDIENSHVATDVVSAIAEAMESLNEDDELLDGSCYCESSDVPPPPPPPPTQQYTGDLESILFKDEANKESAAGQLSQTPAEPSSSKVNESDSARPKSPTGRSSPTSKNGSSRHSRTVQEDWLRSPKSPEKAGRKPPRCPRLELYGASPRRFSRKTIANSAHLDSNPPRPSSPFSPIPFERRRASVDSPMGSPNLGGSRRKSRSSDYNDQTPTRSRSMSPMTTVRHHDSEILSKETTARKNRNESEAEGTKPEASPPSPRDNKNLGHRMRSSSRGTIEDRGKRVSESPRTRRDRSRSAGSRDGKSRSRRRHSTKEDKEGSGDRRSHQSSRPSSHEQSKERRSRKSESPRRQSGRDRSRSAGSPDRRTRSHKRHSTSDHRGRGGADGAAVPSIENTSHRSERSYRSSASAGTGRRERSHHSHASSSVHAEEGSSHVRTDGSEIPSTHEASSYLSERSSSLTGSSGSQFLVQSRHKDDGNREEGAKSSGVTSSRRGAGAQSPDNTGRQSESGHRSSRSPSTRSRSRRSRSSRYSGSKRDSEKKTGHRSTIANSSGHSDRRSSPSATSRDRRSRSLSASSKRRGDRNHSRSRRSANATNVHEGQRSPSLRERRNRVRAAGVANVSNEDAGNLSQYIQHSLGIGPTGSRSLVSSEERHRSRRRSSSSVMSAPDEVPLNGRTQTVGNYEGAERNDLTTEGAQVSSFIVGGIDGGVREHESRGIVSPSRTRRVHSSNNASRASRHDAEVKSRDRSSSASRRGYSASPRRTSRRFQGQLPSIFRDGGNNSNGVLDLANDDVNAASTPQLGRSDAILQLYGSHSPNLGNAKKQRSGSVTFARMNKSENFEGFLEDIKRDAINALHEIP